MAVSADGLGLLFRLMADSSQAQGEISRFRKKVSDDTNVIKGDFGKLGGAVRQEMAGVAENLAAGAGALGRFGASLGPVGLALGAVTGGAIAVGGALFSLAKQAADAGSEIHDLSQRTGVSVETLSAFRLVAQQSGTSLDEFASGMGKFNRTISEAARGSDQATDALKRFGIDPRQALNDQQGALARVFQVINSLPPGIQRATAAQLAFGRSGDRLVDMIQSVGGNLDEFMEKAREAGYVMSTEAAAAADEMGDKLDEVSFKASEVGRTIGTAMIPAMTRGLDQLSDALTRHQGIVHTVAGGIATFLDDYLTRLSLLVSFLDAAAKATLGFNPLAAAPPSTPTGTQSVDAGGGVAVDPRTMRPYGEGFFSPKAKGVKDAAAEAEKARQQFIETLYDWADTFNIPRKALREVGSQSKIHKGWAHRAGMAADISPQYMTPEALEAARRLGLNVIDEREGPAKPGGNWTGPHWHIQAMTKAKRVAAEITSKAIKEATEEENRAFKAQEDILGNLAKAISDADLQRKGAAQSSADHLVALEYERLGIGRLTGEAAELGEAMFAQREQQIRAAEAAERHAAAIERMVEAAERYGEVDYGSVLTGVPVGMPTGPDGKPLSGPVVDSSGMGAPPTAPWTTFGEVVAGVSKSIGEAVGVSGKIVESVFQGIGAAISQTVQAFGGLAGVAKHFGEFAKAVVKNIRDMAVVNAIWEAAQALAAWALSFFWPAMAKKAVLHGKAAAMYGAVAGVAGAMSAAMGGGGSGGGAVAGNTLGGNPNAGSGAQQEGMREDFRSRYLREQAEKNRFTSSEDRRESFSVTAPIVIDGREIARAVINVVRGDGDERRYLGDALRGAV